MTMKFLPVVPIRKKKHILQKTDEKGQIEADMPVIVTMKSAPCWLAVQTTSKTQNKLCLPLLFPFV